MRGASVLCITLAMDARDGQDSIVVNAAGGAGAQVRGDPWEPRGRVLPCELEIDVHAQHLEPLRTARIMRVRCQQIVNRRLVAHVVCSPCRPVPPARGLQRRTPRIPGVERPNT